MSGIKMISLSFRAGGQRPIRVRPRGPLVACVFLLGLTNASGSSTQDHGWLNIPGTELAVVPGETTLDAQIVSDRQFSITENGSTEKQGIEGIVLELGQDSPVSVLHNEKSIDGLTALLNQCYSIDMFGPIPENEPRALSVITTMAAHAGLVANLFKFEMDQMDTLLRVYHCGEKFGWARYSTEWDERVEAIVNSVAKSFCVDSGVFEKIKNKEYQLDVKGNVHLDDGENAPINFREWIKHIDRISANTIEISSALISKVCMPLPVVLDVLRERLDCMSARYIDALLNSPGKNLPFQLDTSILGIIRGIDVDGKIAEINEVKLKVEEHLRDMMQYIDGVIDRARTHPFADEDRSFSYALEDDDLAQRLTNDADITFAMVNRPPGLYSHLLSLLKGFTDLANTNDAHDLFPNQILRWGADRLQNPGNYDTHMLMAYAVHNYVMEDIVRRYGEGAGDLGPLPYFAKPPTTNEFVGILEKLKDGILKLIDGSLPLVSDDESFPTIIANGDMQIAQDQLVILFTEIITTTA